MFDSPNVHFTQTTNYAMKYATGLSNEYIGRLFKNCSQLYFVLISILCAFIFFLIFACFVVPSTVQIEYDNSFMFFFLGFIFYYFHLNLFLLSDISHRNRLKRQTKKKGKRRRRKSRERSDAIQHSFFKNAMNVNWCWRNVSSASLVSVHREVIINYYWWAFQLQRIRNINKWLETKPNVKRLMIKHQLLCTIYCDAFVHIFNTEMRREKKIVERTIMQTTNRTQMRNICVALCVQITTANILKLISARWIHTALECCERNSESVESGKLG